MRSSRAQRWIQAVAMLTCLLISTTSVRAQQAVLSFDDGSRVDQLDKEVQSLRATVESLTKQPAQPYLDSAVIDKKIEQFFKEKEAADAAKTRDEAERLKREGFVVGKDVKFHVTWDPGGFRFKTADDAFSIHLGGRLMTDEVWWTQSPGLRASPVQPPGSPLRLVSGVGPGIGDLTDGFFVRRARFVADGKVFETVEFKTEFNFENYNNISFDESFIGVREVPFLNTVRFGQMHAPFGLEAYTSSRFLPLLERSPLFDAFYQEFAPGIFTTRTFLDQHITTQHMFHRIDNFSQFNGASFSDGRYAYSGRISGLPFYEDDGRRLLHLGLAYQWRKGSSPFDFNGGTALPSSPDPTITPHTDLIRFRARPSLRDSVGLQGLNARVVDTGNIISDRVHSLNGELMWYWGSLWIQSETCWAHVDNAVYPASSAASRRGDVDYWGTYAQVGFFLTGEQRGYDKRMGKYDRVRPHENFFLVRGDNGRVHYGLGAWELIYRFAFIDLNDDTIQGGSYGEHTVGVNWYWNPNIKFQLNYITGHRSVVADAASGNVQGLAIRGALEF